MKVFLTIDVEVWCNGWTNLDGEFLDSFERYVYGRSARGEYALPKTLEILNRHALKAVFFVEPLFAARFGSVYLERIVRLIRDAGQEIQLHLHPEWTDEISPPIIADVSRKRQHLSYYSAAEQTALIAYAKALLESAGSGPLSAFRSGSFAANRDTVAALRANGLLLDSSLNRCHAVSAPELRDAYASAEALQIDGVRMLPVTSFRDGFGRLRPAQVGACGFAEMRQALWRAKESGRTCFVIVSHNFEMLRPVGNDPDPFVVRRFEQLCAFLAEHGDALPTCGFSALTPFSEQRAPAELRVALSATLYRYGEQILRRLMD